jgi:hypothetical protein
VGGGQCVLRACGCSRTLPATWAVGRRRSSNSRHPVFDQCRARDSNPKRGFPQRFLRPPRLPFRQPGPPILWARRAMHGSMRSIHGSTPTIHANDGESDDLCVDGSYATAGDLRDDGRRWRSNPRTERRRRGYCQHPIERPSLDQLPAAFVDPPVMAVAEQHKVVEISTPTVCPVHQVVGVGVRSGPVATGPRAAA